MAGTTLAELLDCNGLFPSELLTALGGNGPRQIDVIQGALERGEIYVDRDARVKLATAS